MEPPPALRLHAESAALQRLARELLRDDDLAEEAVQQTRIAVWKSGKREVRGSYARGILRFVASHLRRDASRRRARETDAAATRTGVAPASDQVVARHEIVRHLAEAVAALREPFREAVVLRYYEGLPPRAIAARLAVPVATVRSRVRRGLAALHADLDRRSADREAWRFGLAVTFGIPFQRTAARTGAVTTAAGPAIGAWIMSKITLVGLAVALALVVLFGAWPPGRDTGEAVPVEASRPAGPDAARAAKPSVTGTPRAATKREPLGAAGREWRIVVVGEGDGLPVAGAAVFAGDDTNRMQHRGLTDASGELTLRLPEGATAPRFVLAAGAGHPPSTLSEVTASVRKIRLALGAGAAGRVVGRVFDSAGNPLPEALVYAGRNEPPSADQRSRGLRSRTPGLVARTGADGTFEIDGVLAGWFRFIATHARHAPVVVFRELTAGEDCRVEVRLRTGTTVTGRALGADGTPLRGATVCQGSHGGFETRRCPVDANGAFRTQPLVAGQKVVLRDERGLALDRVRIPAGAGPLFVWNPRAGASTPSLRGRVVVTERGASPADLTVRVAKPRAGWSSETRTGKDGSFAIVLPRGRDLYVGVFQDGAGLPLLLRKVRVDADAELLLELPAGQGSGRVTARVPDGARSVTLMREAGGAPTRVRLRSRSAEGLHRWEAVPGGASYRVVVDLGPRSGGEYALARFEMPKAGATVELGELRAPGLAPVSFVVTRDASAEASTVEYLLERTDDNPARLLQAVGPVPAGPHRLPPGRYRLDVELSPGGRRSFPFVVEAASKLEVPVRVDARVDVRFAVRGLRAGERASLRVHAGRGTEPIDRTVIGTGKRETSVDAMALTAGPYRVEVLRPDGRHKVQELRVAAGRAARSVIVELE